MRPVRYIISAMAHFEYAVHIAAPPERVWRATIDVERWPDFIPTFTKSKRTDDGAFGLGRSARVTPKGFVGSVWTVTHFDDGCSFTWESDVVPGIHFVGRHAIEPEDAGTRLLLSLEVSGWLAALMSPLTARTYRRNLQREAEAFKSHCEGGAS